MLPRPAWVRDLILRRKRGEVSEPDADRLLDRAIDAAIALEEQTGLDEITDGGLPITPAARATNAGTTMSPTRG